MLLDTTYVPSSCRKTLSLNVLPEVAESEGFIALSANLNVVLLRHEQELSGLARSAHDFNRLATSKRAQKAFSLALHDGARGFIAQIGIVGYSPDQAVMDAIALYADDMTTPFNVTIDGLLRSYREARELVSLPIPTMPFTFQNILHYLNNPPQQNGGIAAAPAPVAEAAAAGAAAAPAAAGAAPGVAAAPEAAAAAAANGQPEAAAAPGIVAPAAAGALPYADAVAQGHRFDPITGQPLNPYSTPRNRPGNVIQPSAARANLNDAVAALNYDGAADIAMEGVDYPDDVPAAAPIIGGLAVLMNNMKTLVIRGMLEPMEVFKQAIVDEEEATRIKKAMVPNQLNTAASRIATVVNADRPVTAPVLRGVVREATTRQLSILERQVE